LLLRPRGVKSKPPPMKPPGNEPPGGKPVKPPSPLPGLGFGDGLGDGEKDGDGLGDGEKDGDGLNDGEGE